MSCVAIASSLSGANPSHVWCVQEEVQTPQTTDESTDGSASSTSLLGGDEATSDGSGDERAGAGGPAGDSGGAAGGGGGGGGHYGQPGHHGGWHHGGSSTCALPEDEDMMSFEEFSARFGPDLMQTATDWFCLRQDWYAYLGQCKAKREFEAALEATASQLLGLLVSRGAATLSGDAATSAPPNSALNRSSLCSPSRPGALAEHACRRGAHASRCFLSRVPFLSLQRAGGAARTGGGVRRTRPLV